MKRNALLKVAASSLALGTTMVGCTGTAYHAGPAFVGSKADKAPDFAEDAERALVARKFDVALTQAEAAVTAQPDSGAYRTLLGRAYVANGRFASAEMAFRDAMTLGNNDARTIITLALVKVAMGDSAGARSLLTGQMDRVPAADYGLAMAIAGDAPEGVRVLSEAIQDPSADAKTRQNLAYAYALQGRWRDARIMAEQDVDPLVAAKRVLAWAETAQPGAEAQRVAVLMGVNPRADDAGLPARLALAPVAPMVQVAQAAPEAPVDADASVEVASAEPQPFTPAPAMIQAIPVQTVAVQGSSASQVTAAPRTAAKPGISYLRRAAYLQPVKGNTASPWVVQLGAFDTADVAKDKWQHMARYNRALGAFPVVNTTATVDGRLYYRLAVSGFGDRGSADALCRAVRNNGGSCFVRQGGAEAKPDRWAAAKAKPKQLASR